VLCLAERTVTRFVSGTPNPAPYHSSRNITKSRGGNARLTARYRGHDGSRITKERAGGASHLAQLAVPGMDLPFQGQGSAMRDHPTLSARGGE
jgi:hypothetical protein